MTTNVQDIRRYLRTVVGDGNTFEIRWLDCDIGYSKGVTRSGYYDNIDQAVTDIEEVEEHHRPAGCYVTLNRVKRALLARSANSYCDPKATTADADIEHRLWLPVDCDVNKPVGVSSSAAEYKAAKEVATTIRIALSKRGWPEPALIGRTGNGTKMLYRIDLANNAESLELIKERTKIGFKIRV